MIPSPWVTVLLALAVYRLVRLAGWDDLPPVQRARNRLTKAAFIKTAEPTPGYWTFQRPTLAHFLGCAFCSGAWLSAAVYVLWLFYPAGTLYACVPLALSAAVGLIAKTLDR